MNLEIINQSSFRVPRKFLVWWAAELSRYIERKTVHKIKKQNLTMVFLTESSAKKLNREFREKNKATDVLSFSPIEENSLGELIFCGEIICRQAKEHGLSQSGELAYLFTHGVLHLLGYEHEQGGHAEKEMFELQDSAFAFLREKWQSRS